MGSDGGVGAVNGMQSWAIIGHTRAYNRAEQSWATGWIVDSQSIGVGDHESRRDWWSMMDLGCIFLANKYLFFNPILAISHWIRFA